jgi:hypothetical protein
MIDAQQSESAGSAPPAPEAPLVSVVVPYGDVRRRPEHVATWTRQQTLPGDRFEVIVLAGRLPPAEEAAVRGELRPQDRFLRRDADGQFAMYAAGAEAARGALLMFTEDHCLADPGCLETVVRYFRANDCDGASVHWGSVDHTAVARVEGLACDISLRKWAAPGHWDRVRIRGFAVRREVYRDAGGFEGRWGHFAEAVLAARLHARGRRIDFMDGPGVRHVNTWTLAHAFRNARGYAWYEAEFGDAGDPEFCERYFYISAMLAGAAPPPADDLRRRRRTVQAVLRREAARGVRPFWRAARALVPEWLNAVAWSASGSARARLAARLALLGARLRFALWWWDEARRLAAFCDYWTGAVRCARADYVARNPRPAPPPLRFADTPGGRLAPQHLPCPYPVEQYGGRTFRWTGPVATFPLDLAPGDYRLEIDTGELRGPVERLPVWVVWCGRVLEPEQVRRQGGRLSVELTREMFAGGRPWLGVAAPALRLSGTADRRRLGLPICSIAVVPREPARRTPAGVHQEAPCQPAPP